MSKLPQKVEPGDRFNYPADFFNQQIDTVRWMMGQQFQTPEPTFGQSKSNTRVWGLNDCGVDVSKGDAAFIEGTSPEAESGTHPDWMYNPRIVLGTSTTYSGWEPVAVADQAITAGDWGWWVVAGVTTAKVTSTGGYDRCYLGSAPGFMVGSWIGSCKILYHSNAKALAEKSEERSIKRNLLKF